MEPLPTLPAHPRLLPGVLVTRRDDRQLQIGLDPSLAVVTADVPQARALLDSLRTGSVPTDNPAAARLVAELVDRGLLIDGDALFADLPDSAAGAGAVAAAYAHADLATAGLLARRSSRPVCVEVPGVLTDLGELARRLLGLSGVPTDGPAYAVLVVSAGEVDRDRVDALGRADLPHLLVRVVEGIVRLGPFVVPGVTACLRCVDAHLAETDPRRALVVEQYVRAGGRRADGVPDPVDPAVMTAAVAWAVRDLVSFVDDEVPSTWSCGIRFGPGMHQEHIAWGRHPRCGCTWLEAVG